ncbi:hypothetical protein HYV81_01130 [Candidatus Woesearchaeota archaeon]|nr:hypothetical protein [Candidatus Woesearchaeota archaeon]
MSDSLDKRTQETFTVMLDSGVGQPQVKHMDRAQIKKMSDQMEEHYDNIGRKILLGVSGLVAGAVNGYFDGKGVPFSKGTWHALTWTPVALNVLNGLYHFERWGQAEQWREAAKRFGMSRVAPRLVAYLTLKSIGNAALGGVEVGAGYGIGYGVGSFVSRF